MSTSRDPRPAAVRTEVRKLKRTAPSTTRLRRNTFFMPQRNVAVPSRQEGNPAQCPDRDLFCGSSSRARHPSVCKRGPVLTVTTTEVQPKSPVGLTTAPKCHFAQRLPVDPVSTILLCATRADPLLTSLLTWPRRSSLCRPSFPIRRQGWMTAENHSKAAPSKRLTCHLCRAEAAVFQI